MRNIKQKQLENILLDAAIVFANYGETDQREIGLTRDGVEFNVTENVREIEYDGKRGKTMGAEVVDSIDAYLSLASLEISLDNLMLALGAASQDESAKTITNTEGGVIADSRYLKNVTAFGICNATGKYKKITIYNALAAGGITIATKDKGEATVSMQLNAHWNPTSVSSPIYKIEDDETGIVESSS